MRFLHSADWHLGRVYHGVSLLEDQAHALQQFVRIAADTRPDAILLAGDIYDRSVPPAEAVRLLDLVLSELILELKIPVVMIAGNHDGPDRLAFGSGLLQRAGLTVRGPVEMEASPLAHSSITQADMRKFDQNCCLKSVSCAPEEHKNSQPLNRLWSSMVSTAAI